jgi:hypothetical protein
VRVIADCHRSASKVTGVSAARRREDAGGLCTEEPTGCVSLPSAGSHCLNGLPEHRSIAVAGRRGQANGGEPAVRSGNKTEWPAFMRLRGAAEAGATLYRRGSSSRGTTGHYATNAASLALCVSRQPVPVTFRLRLCAVPVNAAELL